jgi:hypothetical protein
MILNGLLAEFATPEMLLKAAHDTSAAGYKRVDAFTPQPVHGLTEALGVPGNRVAMVVLIGAIAGALFGYGLQYYMAGLSYVHNVGGRPVHSWPSFIPVTFETTILFAALSAVIGMFAMNGLPQPYHPVFGASHFERASQDRFFLWIEAIDPQFDPEETRRFLESFQPLSVEAVYAD